MIKETASCKSRPAQEIGEIISVIVPSYNHARFIEQTIDGIICQTLTPKRIIVVDDGSTDGSAELLRSLQNDLAASLANLDIELILECLPVNLGGAASFRRAFESIHPDTTLIALCNSDDVWMPEKLEIQTRFLQKNPQYIAVFTNVEWIDETGRKILPDESPIFDAFKQSNRARSAWLKHLVENGNCLCHPSMLARRQMYASCGFYDLRLRQIPDYDMWLRVIQHFDIYILPDRLTQFRRLAHKRNTSSDLPSNAVRTINETEIVFSNLFNRLDTDNFVEAFGSIKEKNDPDFCLELEKAIYLITGHNGYFHPLFKHIAHDILYAFMADSNCYRALQQYGLPHYFYETFAGLFSLWQNRPGRRASKRELQILTILSQWGPGLHDYLEQSYLNQTKTKSIASCHDKHKPPQEIDLAHNYSHADLLRHELSQLLSSRSWRVTRPLREIKSTLTKRPIEKGYFPLNRIEDRLVEMQISKIKRSTSWSLTRPLRFIENIKVKGISDNLERSRIAIYDCDFLLRDLDNDPIGREVSGYLHTWPNAILVVGNVDEQGNPTQYDRFTSACALYPPLAKRLHLNNAQLEPKSSLRIYMDVKSAAVDQKIDNCPFTVCYTEIDEPYANNFEAYSSYAGRIDLTQPQLIDRIFDDVDWNSRPESKATIDILLDFAGESDHSTRHCLQSFLKYLRTMSPSVMLHIVSDMIFDISDDMLVQHPGTIDAEDLAETLMQIDFCITPRPASIKDLKRLTILAGICGVCLVAPSIDGLQADQEYIQAEMSPHFIFDLERSKVIAHRAYLKLRQLTYTQIINTRTQKHLDLWRQHSTERLNKMGVK